MIESKQDWNDDESWLRLADGQLDAGTLRTLVAACEREPQLWKRCALTLLEEQVLQQEMRTLKHSPLGSDAADCLPALTSRAIASAPPVGPIHNSAAARSQRHSHSSWLNSLALVASVAVAFMIGWQSSQRWGLKTVEDGAAAFDSDRSVAAAPPESGKPRESDTQFVAAKPHETLLARDQIENLNSQNFANVIQARTDPELERRTNELRREGYDVRTKSGLVPVILPDGRPAFVPFEQVNVRPPQYINAY